MKTATVTIAAIAATTLGLAGCASGNGSPGATGASGVTVVATTTIWGSITEQVVSCAGDGQTITLIPVGADPHDFSASSADVATMVDANLVIANGLGLEEGLASALASAQQDGARVFEVAPQLNPLPFAEQDPHDAQDAPDHEGDDPHVWQDMERAARGAALIGEQLTQATGDDAYTTCGQQVADQILASQEELEQILAAVPADQRILVTDHDALGYFADAYTFEIAGVVVPGGSTLAEASSAQVAALTQVIRETGVPAIFSNTATSGAVVEALAAEAGDVKVVPLYVDSIGEPGSDADTYQTMMLANANAIAAALS